MNILGIIVIVITGICVWRGYAQGLFRSILIAGGIIAAMVLSAYATPYVSKALQQYTSLDETLEASMIEQLGFDITREDTTKNEQMQLIEALPVPEALKLAVVNNNNSDVYAGLNVRGFEEYLVHYLSCIIINCLSFVIVEVAIMVGLFAVLHITRLLTEVPILHGIDKAGGVILGLIQALAIIWCLFIVIALFGNTSLGIAAFEQISSNPVLNFLFEHNWFMDKMTSITNMLFT
ncbi:MAG: CvpA family protein [Bacteroides sp.]|nr:CvpA family protein [Bacteroides sp.]MCM1550943.1 CvpA family protein [Clostridium sp.]